jgi:hypothetical protein
MPHGTPSISEELVSTLRANGFGLQFSSSSLDMQLSAYYIWEKGEGRTTPLRRQMVLKAEEIIQRIDPSGEDANISLGPRDQLIVH